MITAAEEVERALRLADSHQNSVSSSLNQQQVNSPSSSMNQELTPHQVLKNTDTNLNHQKQADHQMMADINHNADHHKLIRDEHQTPIAISYQGVVDPTHQPLVGQSGLASQRNSQQDNYQGHTTENEISIDASTPNSGPRQGQSVHQDHRHQLAMVAASPQQQQGQIGQVNAAGPDRHLALPSVHQGTSLHSVEPSGEPMLSQAQFDDPIVLFEEVRVKVEELDTSEEIQDPLMCESNRLGSCTDDGEGVNHAMRVKECRVMLQRRKGLWGAGNLAKKHMFPNKKRFECKMGNCEERFRDRRGLEEHMRGKHGQRKLQCTFEGCGAEFVNEHALKAHVSYVHLGKAKPFGCKISGCKERFGRKRSLEDHMRKKHGQAKLQCTFEGCDREFRSSFGLRDHFHSNHAENGVVCNECGKRFAWGSRLMTHKKLVHTAQGC